MKHLILTYLATLICSFYLVAQNEDTVLATVGSDTITRGEFERIYLKNNQMVAEVDSKTLEEYFDLFIIYKLKVAEAKAKGLHNTSAFKQELTSYRDQLIQPYLIDKDVEQRLIEEAYERSKFEVRASHILISVPQTASPEDTLRLYNKALGIRERIIEGEPFDLVARATSDDPSVKRNSGMLPYFSAFQMLYPFENAAYSTPVGKISMPVRTRFGYHILKVHEKHPSKGQVKTAHIMIATPPNSTQEQQDRAKEKIDSIYNLVLQNEDFAQLAKEFSQDPGSAKNGGELPWFGSGRMVPEFEKIAFELQTPGQVSEPIKTQFGWHIVKLLEQKKVGTFEEMLPEIKARMTRDDRSRISRSVFVESIKEKHGFEKDTNAINILINLLEPELRQGDWVLPDRHKNTYLFKFADQNYTLEPLAEKIKNEHIRHPRVPINMLVDRKFDEMVEELALEYEENLLLNENPEIRYLLNEYHDGILLFEIMDRNVWTKAASDKEGLEEFYQQNIDKYKWDERVHAKRYVAVNQKVANKALKLAKSRRGKRLSEDEFINRFVQNNDTLLVATSFAALPTESIVKGYKEWEDGFSDVKVENGNYFFVRVIKTIEDEPKPLKDIRGQVIADYQEHLEEQWIKTLREKYPVEIKQDVFEEIASSLN